MFRVRTLSVCEWWVWFDLGLGFHVLGRGRGVVRRSGAGASSGVECEKFGAGVSVCESGGVFSSGVWVASDVAIAWVVASSAHSSVTAASLRDCSECDGKSRRCAWVLYSSVGVCSRMSVLSVSPCSKSRGRSVVTLSLWCMNLAGSVPGLWCVVQHV